MCISFGFRVNYVECPYGLRQRILGQGAPYLLQNVGFAHPGATQCISIIEEFDEESPVRQQFVIHDRKECHTQFGGALLLLVLTKFLRFNCLLPICQECRKLGAQDELSFRLASSCINIEWSIRSNPLVKSARKIHADAFPTINCFVDRFKGIGW